MATKKKKTNSVILTARQLIKGFTTDVDRKWLWNTMPYQMLCEDEKDDEWKEWNLDWLEYVGIRQISNENRKLLRNYYLANGIINKNDYIVSDENEFSDLVGILYDKSGPFSLKFYPIIPNFINVLLGEYSKRDRSVIVKAVDDFNKSEALAYKEELISSALLQDAMFRKQQELMNNGIDIQSEQGMQEMQTAQQLQEIENKYKTFRSIPEKWGQGRLESDEKRFNMYELESVGFRDSLVADREFWHVNVTHEDYSIELWNPLNTFYHKSPEVRYISNGNYVGNIQLMSISDIINLYGSRMKPSQLENLKGAQSIMMGLGKAPVDDMLKHDPTSFWDKSRPYDQQSPNSIHYEQYVGMKSLQGFIEGKDNISNLDWSNIASNEANTFANPSMIRVTTAYWMSQRKVGHLIKINPDGSIIQDIVDENYIVTDKPLYDKSILRKESKENLIAGEHIDWIWVNDVWRGIKIGPNTATYYQSKTMDFDPIYLDVERCPFQFKGQNSLYGNKLPVEGKIFSERNSISSSPVSKMSSWQVGFNIVNNQVMDFLADEVGKVIVLDQNMIPRNSLNGSWGKNNFPKFHEIMKNHQIAPIDSSLQNTEAVGMNFSHFQAVDLSKTDQILSRLKLAEYFQSQAFSMVGITPQRLGSVQASESATGVQQAVNNSYAQTEMYFEEHMNFLMPRVKQMLLEAAQFIAATKPEADVNYMNSKEENVWFSIEGWKALITDYDIYVNSKSDSRELVQKLQQLAIQNNTASDSLYELARMITSKTPSEIINKLRETDDKKQQEIENQRNHEIQMQREQQQFLEETAAKELKNENYWKERDIQKEIYIAYIRAQGFAKDNDIDDNLIPDSLEIDKFLHEQGINIQDQLFKTQTMNQNLKIHQDNIALEEKKIQLEKYKADKSVEVAKTNKNKYDSKPRTKAKK